MSTGDDLALNEKMKVQLLLDSPKFIRSKNGKNVLREAQVHHREVSKRLSR